MAVVKVVVAGNLHTADYHRAQIAAESLVGNNSKDFEGKFIPLTELDWDTYLADRQRAVGGESWAARDALIEVGKEAFSANEFIAWMQKNHKYTDSRTSAMYQAIAQSAFEDYAEKSKRDFVNFDIAIGENIVGGLVIELFSDIVQKTAENFKSLSSGEKGANAQGVQLTFANSIFHRIQNDAYIQGGDIVSGTGATGTSIYGDTFEDENFVVQHNKRGVVSMANSGLHSNASQFIISFKPLPWMNTKYVAFGQVIEGLGTLQKLQSQETVNTRPVNTCKIVRSSVLNFE